MANEIFYSKENNRIVYSGASNLVVFSGTTPQADWYEPDGNTRRYYKLGTTDSLVDDGVDGVDFTNTNSVSFTNNYAEFNGTDNYLSSSFSGYTSNMTFFMWYKFDTDFDPLAGNTLLGIDGTHDILFRFYNDGVGSGNVCRYVDNGAVNNNVDVTLHQSTGTWYAMAVVRAGGTSTVYTGTTGGMVVGGTCDANATTSGTATLTAGAQNGDRFFDGAMSGLIIEDTNWDTTKLDDQAEKGPYYNY